MKFAGLPIFKLWNCKRAGRLVYKSRVERTSVRASGRAVWNGMASHLHVNLVMRPSDKSVCLLDGWFVGRRKSGKGKPDYISKFTSEVFTGCPYFDPLLDPLLKLMCYSRCLEI